MSEPVLSFDHARFGTVEARADELLHFPGLPGFPAARRFVVRGHDRGSAFAWLISVDDPGLAFVIANPWEHVKGYDPAFSAHHLRAVDHRAGDELRIVAIAAVSSERTALNLAAPVLINMRNRRGIQALLEDDRYSTHRVVVEPRASAPQPADRPEPQPER